MTTIELPIRTYSLLNMRWHWAVKAKYGKQQRQSVFLAVRAAGVNKAPEGAFTVRLVRVGKRRLDKDNLASSWKYVQDSVALAMGIDDGDPRINWQYEQQVGKDYSVIIHIGA